MQQTVGLALPAVVVLSARVLFAGLDWRQVRAIYRAIAVVDGLKGFPEAITAAFPETTVQTCIVHLIRHLERPQSRGR